MRHDGLIFDEVFNLRPYPVKPRGIAGIAGTDAVYLRIHIEIKVAGRTNQQAQLVYNFPMLYPDQANLANAPALSMGGFKVNSCKIKTHGIRVSVIVIG